MDRILAWREQIAEFGDISPRSRAILAAALAGKAAGTGKDGQVQDRDDKADHDPRRHRPQRRFVSEPLCFASMPACCIASRSSPTGFEWEGRTYASLSAVARAITGVRWNGHRFFALDRGARHAVVRKVSEQGAGARPCLARAKRTVSRRRRPMTTSVRCAIYTRVSTDAGLEQDFNSLDAQREAAEAYIKSQAHEGWRLMRERFDDGGYSGGSMERPALQNLLDRVRERRIDVIVVYKVDRLTRSLADFAKLVETFDAHGVAFVSVTQAFNTTTSMGRLTLNVLLSFAQFEREVTGERIRDKIAASKKKGLWMGGVVPLGYRVEDRKLHVVEEEAANRARDLRPLFGTGVGARAAAGIAAARHSQPGPQARPPAGSSAACI